MLLQKWRSRLTSTPMKMTEWLKSTTRQLISSIVHLDLKSTFNRVSACQTAKEIWNLLEVTYEGTSQVKDTRISMLSQDYELFVMKKEESISEMFTRFTNIINGLSALDKTLTNKEKVLKILRSLPSEWEAKCTAIMESKDLATFTMDQLMGSLIAYELNLKRKSKVEDDSKKMKNLAFEATTSKKEKKEKIEEEDSEDEEELALLSSKFKRFLRKRNERKRFPNKNTYKREESSKANQGEVICYNCQRPGHMAYECPHPKVEKSKNKNLYKGKKKSLLATWMNQSEDESTDDDSSQNEVANLCFMAKEDSEDEDNEVTNDSYTFDELLDAFHEMHDVLESFKVKNKSLNKNVASLTLSIESLEKENLNLKQDVSTFSSMQDDSLKLESKYESLLHDNHVLNDKVASLYLHIEHLQNEKENALKKLDLYDLKVKALTDENKTLHEKVIGYEKRIDKFNKGKQTLDHLLHVQRFPFDKSGLGHSSSSEIPKSSKTNFVKEKTPKFPFLDASHITSSSSRTYFVKRKATKLPTHKTHSKAKKPKSYTYTSSSIICDYCCMHEHYVSSCILKWKKVENKYHKWVPKKNQTQGINSDGPNMKWVPKNVL
ncbi:hypothetical protein Dimus_038991 [Dionaea muscipula]